MERQTLAPSLKIGSGEKRWKKPKLFANKKSHRMIGEQVERIDAEQERPEK